MVYFYWTNRRDAINNNSLQKEQMTNHFAKAGSFATKVLYIYILLLLLKANDASPVVPCYAHHPYLLLL